MNKLKIFDFRLLFSSFRAIAGVLQPLKSNCNTIQRRYSKISDKTSQIRPCSIISYFLLQQPSSEHSSLVCFYAMHKGRKGSTP